MPRIDSSSRRGPWSWPLVYVGVMLTTLASLVLELSLTRIFSVIFYYHFAFLAISIALFGLGAGGVFSYVVAGWRGALLSKLGGLAAAGGLAVAISLLLLLTRDGDLNAVTLGLVYFFSALPFFLAGTVLSLVISETIARVDRVYFFDLIGAAAGCMLLIPFLNQLGGPNTVIAAAVLYIASAAIWYHLDGNFRGRVAAVAIALALVGLVTYNMKNAAVDVRFAKGRRLTGERFVKWNSFSRIALAPDAPGSSMTSIIIDADAATGIACFDFDHLSADERRSLLRQGPAVPYILRPGAKTLVIGAGGGWDVARALASGSTDVTAVEINPIIANVVMRERFAGLSHRLYLRPEVHMHVEDGRSFVRRSTEKYQVLQATLVDTWASTAAGAYALSENNLYTSDAFYDYLSHLTADGMLAFTRWGFDPPRESLRLLSLARVALARLGEHDLARHVVVGREGASKLRGWGAADTVLISRHPFSKEDVDRARAALPAAGLDIVYLPGTDAPSAFRDLLTAPDPRAYERRYPYDISAVDDNRPFFFYTVQPGELWNFLRNGSRQSADYNVNRAVPTLFALIGVSIAATVVILALPPALLGTRLPRDPGALRFLAYFVAIGAGYILIQVALIQKFVLFLGHPTYALTVIIFSMLVSSGVGSYASRRLVSDSGSRLRNVLMGIAAAVTVLASCVTPIAQAGVGWPLWLKIPVAAALIAPAGFLMGIPFPTGLSMLEQRHKPSVRWAWSLNAASSVLGSAGAIFLALYVGLQNTLLIGGVLYLGAFAALRWSNATALTAGRAREGAVVGNASVV